MKRYFNSMYEHAKAGAFDLIEMPLFLSHLSYTNAQEMPLCLQA